MIWMVMELMTINKNLRKEPTLAKLIQKRKTKMIWMVMELMTINKKKIQQKKELMLGRQGTRKRKT
jgi:hypothetical protein